MWILPNHKSDLDINTVCGLFEKSVLYRSKPSNTQTWKRRLKNKSIVACRVSNSMFDTNSLTSKCLELSKNHRVVIDGFNEENYKEWLDFCKLEYKVRSSIQKNMWSTPTSNVLGNDLTSYLFRMRKRIEKGKSTFSAWLQVQAEAEDRGIDIKKEMDSWATPTTQETEHHDLVINSKGRRISKNGKQDHSLNLADQASLNWSTPCVGYEGETWEVFRKRKCNIGKGLGKGTLSVQVDYTIHNWPTPRANKDTHSEDANRWIARFIKFKGGISSSLALTVDLENFGITKEKLENELKSWSTPAARDYKGTQGRTNKEESLGDLPGQTEGPWSTWKSDLPQEIKTAKELSKKLNPRWVENLMGLPLGWVSAKAYISESEKN